MIPRAVAFDANYAVDYRANLAMIIVFLWTSCATIVKLGTHYDEQDILPTNTTWKCIAARIARSWMLVLRKVYR